jgi:hypothetical protein
MPETRLVGKRFLGLLIGSALLGALWFPYVAFQDARSRMASLANCEDNGLGAWRLILRQFAESHAGQLPTEQERAVLAPKYRAQSTHFALTCNTGAPYCWGRAARKTSAGAAVPVAWCGAPHGFSRKWRNVLYSDLSLRRVPETEVARMEGAW